MRFLKWRLDQRKTTNEWPNRTKQGDKTVRKPGGRPGVTTPNNGPDFHSIYGIMTLKSTRIYGIMGTNFSGKMARTRQMIGRDTPAPPSPRPETALPNKILQFSSAIFCYNQHYCRFHRVSAPRFKHSKAGFSISVSYIDCMTSKTEKKKF